jgi:hypothetical protein
VRHLRDLAQGPITVSAGLRAGVPGYARGQRADIVFAIYLQNRRLAIRVAVLDADTDEVLGRPAASLPISSQL